MLLKSSFDMTMHNHTQVSKHRKQSENSDGLLFPTNPTAQILLPQISTSMEPSKMTSVGKGLGAMTRLLKKWLQVQDSDWYKTGIHGFVSRWLKAVEVGGDFVKKMSVVNTSSYPMNMFKEF
jgi:hypothetical protein